MSNLLSVSLCLALSIAPGTGDQAAPPQGSAAPATKDEGLSAYYFLLGRYLEGEGKIDEAAGALKKAIEEQLGWPCDVARDGEKVTV